MREDYQIIEIQPENVVAEAMKLKTEGFRLVQMCTTRIEDGYELSYSFAKEYEFINHRFSIQTDVEITSISGVFETAFLYENEMKDLFGVKINFINVDYKGQLYKIDTKEPCK